MAFSIAELLRRSLELDAVSDSARIDTEVMLAAAVQKDRTYLYTWPEKTLSVSELEQFNVFFDRRKGGEPIAYIVGEKEFWSLPLFVNASTLIPRSDTELLVETVLGLECSRRAILDLGTGTGAIALALASELPDAKLIGVDASLDAIQLAKRNQLRHGFENIRFIESDWFSALEKQKFDVIVSNPPYIEETDPHLKLGDVVFEPTSALISADKGLADITLIIEQGCKWLEEGGSLLIEHGWQQAEGVRTIFKKNNYQQIYSRKDLAGHERITMARR
ncbi:[protein release factor]-glutamine N5-methyltransferase [Alteromonadaceae bacterium Bs31]|nr:[protein release factor]-glutamine N5-methyltransferase [Alteromonadaceae bacterium Bs31]